MPELAQVSARQAIAAFERLGWVYKRFRNGHHVMGKTGNPMNLSIPDHSPIKQGLLRGLILDAQVSVQEFIAALKA